jgi:hypothetical protein
LKKDILSTFTTSYLYSTTPEYGNQYNIHQNPDDSRELIYSNRVIGVTFSPVVVAALGLQVWDIGNVVKGFSVLNTFYQVWVRDPVEADADRVDLARCYELFALFGENIGIEDKFGVLNIWTICLEDVVLCRTVHT